MSLKEVCAFGVPRSGAACDAGGEGSCDRAGVQRVEDASGDVAMIGKVAGTASG